jgi:GMP synthase-like glutamine amidotransferase
VKPVLVLQHQHNDGPSYLATWLAARGLAMDLRNTEAGDAYPESIAGHAALAILGGAMSANDPLPSLRQAERLILQALARDVPVLGHCLGGQLMARALGAAVTRSPKPEVGWHAIEIADSPAARDWFGAAPRQLVYQWHGEAFAVPAGAVHLAGNPNCPHQAFALGRSLAMQFHVEIDAAKHAAWAAETDPAYHADQRVWPTVHSGERMRRDGATALEAQQRLADRIYARWIAAAR